MISLIMLGAIVKEKPEDRAVLMEYCENVVKLRKDREWQDLYQAAIRSLRE